MRLLPLLLLTLILVGSVPMQAAAPISHYIIARQAASSLLTHPKTPESLRIALGDAEGLQAFCSGAITPDIAVLNHDAHHYWTSSLPVRLRAHAWQEILDAAKLPATDPTRRDKLRWARYHLAFAYGWLSHCATDLVVHPVVNAEVGDAYEFNSLMQKKQHAGIEVELDKYLVEQYPDDAKSFRYRIPTMLAKVSRTPLNTIVTDAEALTVKMNIAELWTYARNADDHDWEPVIWQSINDTVAFVVNPAGFKDWDLDVGRMSTTDYEIRHKLAIEINGGTLPKAWPQKYGNWYERTKGLSGDALRKALEILILNKPLPIAPQPKPQPPAGSFKCAVFALGPNDDGRTNDYYLGDGTFEVKVDRKSQYVYQLPMKRNIILRADAPFYWKDRIRQSNTTLTPNLVVWRSGDEEIRAVLLEESFTWKIERFDNRKLVPVSGWSVSTSRAIPERTNDVLSWRLPNPISSEEDIMYWLTGEAHTRWRREHYSMGQRYDTEVVEENTIINFEIHLKKTL